MKSVKIALFCVLMALGAHSESMDASTPQMSAERCQRALNACDKAIEAGKDLISAQDLSIKSLKSQNDVLKQQLVDSKEKEPTIPTWLVFVIGVLAGSTAALVAK